MSDKKQGLFSRIRRAISSSLSEAVDSLTDPGQEVALMLDDLAAQIQQSEKDLRQAIVERKVLERKCEDERRKHAEWTQRAEQAVRMNDDGLARAALQQQAEVAAQLADDETALREQTLLCEQMQTSIRAATSKLKALNLRRGSLMAQARAVKQGGSSVPGVLRTGASSSRLDHIEAKIHELEAMNEVDAELNRDGAVAAEIAAKFSQMSDDGKLDDELARLKAKLAGKNALSSGESGETPNS